MMKLKTVFVLMIAFLVLALMSFIMFWTSQPPYYPEEFGIGDMSGTEAFYMLIFILSLLITLTIPTYYFLHKKLSKRFGFAE